MALNKQMEMFEDGGLKDEGGMIDEVSGNDVPPGSTREEVRDDIPAQLSEGEFVFPADVVRFIGLEKLMQLRQEAKQGLKQMEAMGQMGNSEEATMPDDLPFDETDLDMEDELEYNRGGVVEAANGAYIPNLGKMYGNQAKPYAPVDYTTALGTSSVGAPQTKTVRYFNPKTNQTRDIPHIINADGTMGATIYPVPDGFVVQEQAPKEAAKETKTATTKVAPIETTDSGGDDGGMEGDLGGARTTIGGVEYAVQYNFDGTVGLQSIDNYKATGNRNFQIATPAVASAIKTQTLGQLSQLSKGLGVKGTALAEFAKKMNIDTPRYDKLGKAIDKGIEATRTLDKTRLQDIFDIDKALDGSKFDEPIDAKIEDLSRSQIRDLDDAIQTGRGTDRFTEARAAKISRDAEADRLAKEQAEEKEKQRSLRLDEVRKAQKRIAENKAAQEKAERENRVTGREAGMSMGDDGGSSSSSSPSGSTGFGDVGYATAKGGFIPKLKKKPKKMKRGGLASR